MSVSAVVCRGRAATVTGYQNYIDNHLTVAQWSAQYFPTPGTFSFLQQVKCQYNPFNIFAVPNAVNISIPLPVPCSS